LTPSTLTVNEFALGRATVFREHLDEWWTAHGRRYPWRDTRDPYKVLVAELMLHRTKADQVVPVYERFLNQYPTAKSLTHTSNAEILRMLRPLGLHWRSRLVADLFSEVNSQMGGHLPTSAPELRKLPGVSDYISGAVACFSRDELTVILDTNIVRVLGRVTGNPTTDASRRSRQFRGLIHSLLPRSSARRFYFALIDLAALVCLPQDPLCIKCPVAAECAYARVRRIDSALVRPHKTLHAARASRLGAHGAGLTAPASPGQHRSVGSASRMGAHGSV
jgi:A/G-specific adenine glycosylase